MGWITGWDHRQKITIGSAALGMSGNLTDFTIAIHVPSSNTAFWAGVKADGTDVRFTSSDGETLLKFEIESFDNTGDDAWFHAKVPSLLYASDPDIYLYYGNSGAASAEDINNTWESNFLGVYHLNQDKAAGAFADSTVNAYNGTNYVTTDGLGQIDRGRTYDGVDGTGINIDSTIPQNPTLFSLAISGKNTGTLASGDTLFGHRTETTRLIQIFASPGGTDIVYQLRSSGNSLKTITKTGLTLSNWNRVGITFDKANNVFELYVNGVLAGTDVTNFGAETFTATANYIGATNSGAVERGIAWEGQIDEVKVSGIRLTADWFKADYQSVLGTWLTFGAEEDETVYTLVEDSINAVDSVSLTAYKTITDSIALTEGFLLNGASYVFVTDSVAVTDEALTNYKEVRILDTVTGVDIAGSINQNSLMFGVTGFPSGQTVEYRIKTQQGVVLQDWTSVNVAEDEEIPGYSTYTITNVILDNGFQGKISWRINGTNYYAVEILNFFESFVFGQISVGDIEASEIIAKEATVAANGTALTALQGDVTGLLIYAVGMSKWKNNKLAKTGTVGTVETWVLYDDDGTTPLLTWEHDTSTMTREKAT